LGLEAFDHHAVGGRGELEFATLDFAGGGIKGVDHAFALAFGGDDAVHAEEAEVVADGGLGEVQLFAEAGDVAFAFGEHEDHAEAIFVGEEVEKLTKLKQRLVGSFRGHYFLQGAADGAACHGARGGWCHQDAHRPNHLCT